MRKDYGITKPHISYGAFEKPYLTEYPGIHFNLSHCPKGCICAVSDKEIGVDIQDIRPFSWDIARRVCCDNELKMLTAADDKAKLFARIWSMKESFLKMTGEGLSKISTVDTTTFESQIDVWVNNEYVISAAIM